MRTSGILLHPTSLPGPHGSGDLGDGARQFVDFLVQAEQSFWQMLPVGPVGYGNSPYSAQSAFAGNPLLIALASTHAAEAVLPAPRVDYAAATSLRTRGLRAAFAGRRRSKAFARFCERCDSWLDDYALYRALKSRHAETAWTAWPTPLRDRNRAELARAARELAEEIEFRKFEQWLFAEQWQALRAYSNERGVGLIGDIPIFLAHDSADVWQHRELFQLDARGQPTVVSGVPPDYFSATGQRWGNPLYRWARLRKGGYAFWVDRMRATLERFDVVRLDHFIGFRRNWEIPADEATAVHGRWVKAPGADLLRVLARRLGRLPLIAEDLGEIGPDVRALRDGFNLPGIKILQFAFGNDPSADDFLPHNYTKHCVVYTGTHDNDTTVGWFHGHERDSSTRSRLQVEKEQAAVLAYLGASDAREVHWDMIRLGLMSVANTAIFPLQDVLGLGSEARMNRPGRAEGNWEWRFPAGATSPSVAQKLAELTRRYGRQRRAVGHERRK